jgi:hypothetical protein
LLNIDHIIPGLSKDQKYISIDTKNYVFFIKVSEGSVKVPWEKVSSLSCGSSKSLPFLISGILALIAMLVEMNSYRSSGALIFFYLLIAVVLIILFFVVDKSYIKINASGIEYTVRNDKSHSVCTDWIDSANLLRESHVMFLHSLQTQNNTED